jgi:uncharacterized protein
MKSFSIFAVAGTLVWMAVSTTWLAPSAAATAAGPSFDCGKARGSIEQLICEDEALSAVDRTMASVYAAASRKAVDERPRVLRTEQRGWIKGRNDCWKSDAPRACVEGSYQLRIAALQARYHLVEATGPMSYTCEDDSRSELAATFFATDPRTVIVERGDRVSLMFLQPSASGAKYAGGNESFWEHQGEAMLTWGHGAPEIRCVRKRTQDGSTHERTTPRTNTRGGH